MWLTRFHLIEPRDYNHVARIYEKSGFITKRYSLILLSKGIMLHIFGKRSWRRVADEFGIPHVSIYHFYKDLVSSGDLYKVLAYFIERRIILFISDERHITREMLDTEEIVRESLIALRKIV